MADEGTERREGLPTLAVAAGIATIRLNRPAVHNRVDLAELDRLVTADPAARRGWKDARRGSPAPEGARP